MLGLSSLRLGLHARGNSWLARQIAALTAADGTKPAAIADFENWRFARTVVAVGDVPSASAADLQVLEECTFNDWFAYTASSTTARTYTNASGVILNDLAADAPRRDYSAGASRLLLENASTNLIRQSGNPYASPWGGVTVGSGLTDATPVTPYLPGSTPYSFTTANGANGANRSNSFSATSGVTYTTSLYLEKGVNPPSATDWSFLLSGHVCLARLTWATLAVSILSGSGDLDVEDLGIGPNGRQLVKVTSTCVAPSTAAAGIYVYICGSGAVVSSDVIVHGLQLEASTFASSYIPTEGSAITRAIETAQDGPVVNAILQRTACTDVVWTTSQRTAVGTLLGGTTNVKRVVGVDSNTVRATQTSNLDVDLGSGAVTGAMVSGLAWDGSGRRIFANGASASDANQPGDRSTTYMGRSGTVSSDYGNGLYKRRVIYPARLSQAACEALLASA